MYQKSSRPTVLAQDRIPITNAPAELLPHSLTERASIEIQRTRTVLAETRRVLQEQLARLETIEASLALLVDGPPGGAAVQLTPQEREILLLIAENYTDYAIGQRIKGTDHTAKTYMKYIHAKLGTRGRTTAILKAWQLGLI